MAILEYIMHKEQEKKSQVPYRAAKICIMMHTVTFALS